jgi:hypothetical protein
MHLEQGFRKDGTNLHLLGAVRRWPTPDANASNDGETAESWLARREREKAKGQNGNGMGMPLAMAANLWPTPSVQDEGVQGGHLNSEGFQSTLAGSAKTWPTPRASEAQTDQLPNFVEHSWATPSLPNGGRTPGPGMSPTGMMPDGSKRQVDLGWQAKGWATPMAMDGVKPSAGNRRSDDLSHQAQAQPTNGAKSSSETRRLNPRFVEWLMGWPVGWTDCASPVTESFPSWLALHSSLLHEGLA